MLEVKKVYLNSSSGEIERVLVKEVGEILLVCRKEEWERAIRAGEEPITIGFKRADMIERDKAAA